MAAEPREATDRRAVQSARSGASPREAVQPEPSTADGDGPGCRSWRWGPVDWIARVSRPELQGGSRDRAIARAAGPRRCADDAVGSGKEVGFQKATLDRVRVHHDRSRSVSPSSPTRSSSERPSMYERFFGFRERPFDLTPSPRFLVMTEGHREALSNLEYAISSRKGITRTAG